MTGWEMLRRVEWPAFASARVQVHWAVQAIAALGGVAIEPQPDDSHRSLTLDPVAGRLIGQTTRGGVHAGLDLASLELLLLTGDGARIDGFGLDGSTLEQAMDWLGAALSRAGGEGLTGPLAVQEYNLPDHPVARGARFEANELTAELAKWFVSGDSVLRTIEDPHASPVRLWPHHFDLARLISLEGEEGARSIGVGLSPGDLEIPRPYVYVSPWPYGDRGELPELAAGGEWHLQGWVGAVLEAESIVADDDGSAQASRVGDFVASAVTACRNLLERV